MPPCAPKASHPRPLGCTCTQYWPGASRAGLVTVAIKEVGHGRQRLQPVEGPPAS